MNDYSMPIIHPPDSPGLTSTSEEDESKESSNSHSNGATQLLVPACISSEVSSGPGSTYCRQTRESVLQRLSEALLRRSLIKIDLSQRGLQPTDARLVKMALLQNAHVLVLKLGYNHLGDRGATILADGIAKHPGLESLDLGFNDVGDEGCQALASAIGPNLHTLYLAGNLIGQDGAFALADLIRRTGALKKLYLTGNRLTGEGVAAITEAMLDNESDISNVGVEEKKATSREEERATLDSSSETTRGTEELFIGGTDMGRIGCHAVGRLLANSSHLRVLSLTGCDFGDSSTKTLASSIKSNRNNVQLETLQLSFNRVGCKGMEYLSNAIWGLHSLRELRLDNNRIGEQGVQHLAGVLPTLPSLETLDIGFNAIKTRGIILLMKSIADSTVMKSLSISGNKVDANAAKALTYALAYSPSLTSLAVEGCDIRSDCQRQIVSGIFSNSRTSMRSLAGFAVGPVIAFLGFPAPIEHWSNEQVFNFIHLIWSDQNEDEEEKTTDPLNFLDNDDRSKPMPVEASIVIELARKTFASLVEDGVDIFSKPAPPKQASSPLVGDTIMLESVDLLLQEGSGRSGRDIPCPGKSKSFVAAPEASQSKQLPPDPARKKRIVEWLCQNMPFLNKVSQQPFSSSELARLHQYYFAPVVNESGGGTPAPPQDVTVGGPLSMSVPGMQTAENTETFPANNQNLLLICDKGSPKNGITSMPTLMKRKVSYRFLGDAALASAPRLDSEGSTTPTPHTIIADELKSQASSAATLIEKGPTMQSLPPKSKRARRNRSRISFLPKIKDRLDAYLDMNHEKALKTMRQLYFVEQAILSGQVNPIDPIKTVRTHLCGDNATDAETIIVDMI
ncbi:hypothetical protein FisN_4Lh284 [Fistulifera solaris]|uniref:Uncharacterized protein n=1 Tax=Fistulifera solaris TaxID=1519565 RepID=A0A1Z5KD21_FISSO|nr:hypothetical protein FisN_4Lh284 [Fistulifera solaris]|eukprot:GAX24194.1 hypothetical protein FisN_4Lh284 [Fistulifera solaris]